MLLLGFTCRNHRSIRDEVTLSMVSTGFKIAAPRDGDWVGATTRVAGLYGANASGKTTLLDAVDHARNIVWGSATVGRDQPELPFQPFALRGGDPTSEYVFDLVLDGVRYEYGFELDASRIHGEWLYSYPHGRRRVLFERAGDAITAGKHLDGPVATAKELTDTRVLFLSAGALAKVPVLARLRSAICNQIGFAQYTDQDRHARLEFVKAGLQDASARRQAGNLLRFADVGIGSVDLVDKEIDEAAREQTRRLLAIFGQDGEPAERQAHLVFGHDSGSGQGWLGLDEQSSGTISWLSLVIPALTMIRQGSVLLVDELDASLHPRLAGALVAMFKNPDINMTGAQLIFTSHDTTLLGPLSAADLDPGEVWLCEKDRHGVTALVGLAEYRTRAADNFERRYLQGRYGAVPTLSPDELAAALEFDVPIEAVLGG